MNSPFTLTAAEGMWLIRYAAVVMEITRQAILNQKDLDVWGKRGIRIGWHKRKERLHLWWSWTLCTSCSLSCFTSSSGREEIKNCLTTQACQSSLRSFQRRLLKTCGLQLHVNHPLEEWNCNCRLLTTISWVTMYLSVRSGALALSSRVRCSRADPMPTSKSPAWQWCCCCCQHTELENLS